jgi:exosortase/archaeosortase family protein
MLPSRLQIDNPIGKNGRDPPLRWVDRPGGSRILSTSTYLTFGTVRDWRRDIQQRWLALAPATRVRVQIGVFVGVVAAAYHYSLSSLFQTINFDTPLAYISLVPLIAAALAYGLRRPTRPEPAIHDRQLDYIIGIPLIGVAVAINEYLPKQQSVLFWLRRMDLVSLPFFVAGVVALLFGTRVLWRQKLAIAYLFLAWPWPYTTVLLGALNGFTNITVAGLTAALKVIHLATPVTAGNTGGGLYSIVHNGRAFPVSVVTACSGVDGMVGFLLVGTAFAIYVRGGIVRKLLWLAVGMVLLWATNLARLLLIFWAGKTWGEQMALKVLHPIAGLVIFNIGIVFMVLLLRPFGLRLSRRDPVVSDSAGAAPPGGGRRTPIFMVGSLLVILAAILNVNNSSLSAYNLVAGAVGEPRLSSYLADPASPAGWTPIFTNEYQQTKPLFGESSRWFRYTYFDRGGGDLYSTLPVTADVINAAGARAFGAYGVEACYNFHGFTLRDIADVSLGDGITGQAMSFSTQSNGDWSIVYWIWPVKTGTQSRYERIVLYLLNTEFGTVIPRSGETGISGVRHGLSSQSVTDNRLLVNRAFLVGFAREIVQGQVHITEPATEIAQVSPPVPAPLSTPKGVARPRPRPHPNQPPHRPVHRPTPRPKSPGVQWIHAHAIRPNGGAASTAGAGR